LGRALDALSPVAEEIRGRVLLAAIEDSGLVRKGWGSDRRVARQVSTLQATTPNSPDRRENPV